MRTITIILLLALTVPANAATNCTTRKSGSVTTTSCSNAYGPGGHTQCRSYKSGNVVKTFCR